MKIMENAQSMVKGAIKSLVNNKLNDYGHAMFILRAQVNAMSKNEKNIFSNWLEIEKINHPIKFLDDSMNKRFSAIFDVC